MRLRIDAREDPRTLGLLRIGLGICLFGDIASLLPHAAYLYGDAGIAPATPAILINSRRFILISSN